MMPGLWHARPPPHTLSARPPHLRCRYDPINGLGAPETFDHPNISYHDTRCRSKLEELEIADPSRRAALALHGRDVEDYDQDLVPEADRETRELDMTNTRWAPSYGKD